jgi:hypothetical protein
MTADTFPICDQEYRDEIIIATRKYVCCRFFNCMIVRQGDGCFEDCEFVECAIYVNGLEGDEATGHGRE